MVLWCMLYPITLINHLLACIHDYINTNQKCYHLHTVVCLYLLHVFVLLGMAKYGTKVPRGGHLEKTRLADNAGMPKESGVFLRPMTG